MTIDGTNEITIDDILVGEVWFASGQSNMKDRFDRNKNPALPEEYATADLSTFRFSTRKGWFPVSKAHERRLSRVAFYFGIDLYDRLDVPVGFVFRAANGSPIQAWMPEDVASSLQQRLNIPSDWNEGPDPGGNSPGQQFGFRLEPVIPYAIRGVIWYQGERNAKKHTGYEYDTLLETLVTTWRKLWAEQANEDVRNFPFYYVQPPVRDEAAEFPWLRDRMRRAVDMIDNVGMAVFVDHGGPAYHPPKKKPAGERLARLALHDEYGYENLVASGPLLDTVAFNNGNATLGFRHVGDGLHNNTGDGSLRFFEIAGEDGEYVPATASITGNDTVVVAIEDVSNPAYVRYLFEEGIPEVSLVNSAGLPASPFMTDDFKPER
jgi:sialate O-acetylesterase